MRLFCRSRELAEGSQRWRPSVRNAACFHSWSALLAPHPPPGPTDPNRLQTALPGAACGPNRCRSACRSQGSTGRSPSTPVRGARGLGETFWQPCPYGAAEDGVLAGHHRPALPAVRGQRRRTRRRAAGFAGQRCSRARHTAHAAGPDLADPAGYGGPLAVAAGAKGTAAGGGLTFIAQPPHLRHLAFGHKSFAVSRPLALLGNAFYAVLVHRLAIYAPRFLPTLGRPHAVALHFIHCDQLMAELAPAGVRSCWAHETKSPHVAGSLRFVGGMPFGKGL